MTPPRPPPLTCALVSLPGMPDGPAGTGAPALAPARASTSDSDSDSEHRWAQLARELAPYYTLGGKSRRGATAFSMKYSTVPEVVWARLAQATDGPGEPRC